MQNTVRLGAAAEGRFIESRRFNTTYISFHFYTPLNTERLAEDALLPYLLTSCSADYKSFTELNLTLLKLYGAELSCSVSKSGDYLHSKIGIRVINPAFAFDKEDTVRQAADILLSLIFNPSVKDQAFRDADVSREKRKTIERIDNEINNKRSFARTRLTALMFEGEPYGEFIYGTREAVEKIDGRSMYNAWQRLLSGSEIQLNVVSSESPDELFALFSDKLSRFERSEKAPTVHSTLRPTDTPRTVREEMEVTQGKLVMGFSSDVSGDLDKALPLMLFADIFGGGPYSRLFENVREKQSLCYYCSAAQRRNKGYMIVDSGVEAENCEKAKAAILAELDALKKGEIEEERLEASKKSVIDSLHSYGDSASALDSWYTRDIYTEKLPTPEAAAIALEAITREDIERVARGIKLHTVYELMPEKEGANNE